MRAAGPRAVPNAARAPILVLRPEKRAMQAPVRELGVPGRRLPGSAVAKPSFPRHLHGPHCPAHTCKPSRGARRRPALPACLRPAPRRPPQRLQPRSEAVGELGATDRIGHLPQACRSGSRGLGRGRRAAAGQGRHCMCGGEAPPSDAQCSVHSAFKQHCAAQPALHWYSGSLFSPLPLRIATAAAPTCVVRSATSSMPCCARPHVLSSTTPAAPHSAHGTPWPMAHGRNAARRQRGRPPHHPLTNTACEGWALPDHSHVCRSAALTAAGASRRMRPGRPASGLARLLGVLLLAVVALGFAGRWVPQVTGAGAWSPAAPPSREGPPPFTATIDGGGSGSPLAPGPAPP